jgi:hypothetical protein
MFDLASARSASTIELSVVLVHPAVRRTHTEPARTRDEVVI